MLARWGYRVPDVWGEMNRLNREVSRMFGETGSSEGSGVFPPLNVYDDGESVVVRAEIPGVDPKSIEVNASSKSLTIKGERPKQVGDEKQSFHRRERGYGRFNRSLTLPQEVNPDKVRAEYRLGILEVVLPKSEDIKPRKIDVRQA